MSVLPKTEKMIAFVQTYDVKAAIALKFLEAARWNYAKAVAAYKKSTASK